MDAPVYDETARSYRVFAPELFELYAQAVAAVAEARDVDADGRGDILLTVVPAVAAGRHYRSAYLLNGADLPLLDAEDGIADGQIFLSSIVRDRR